jgi:hypothetical protein
MKFRKLILGIACLGVSAALIGCGNNTSSVSASLPNGFEAVTTDSIGFNNEVLTLKNVNTGCYYALSNKSDWNSGTSITQMLIEKDGASVPYCD